MTILEVLLFSRLWSQTPGPVILQVMWAFGISMNLMALFLKMPSKLNLMIGIILTLMGAPFISRLFPNTLWNVFFGTPFFMETFWGIDVYFLYAVGPWFGLMLLGYALPPYPWTTKKLAAAGMILMGLFLVQGLMASPADWMDMMRVSKYPPEPRFIWGTLGISAFILIIIRRFPVFWLATLGREPLTVYTVHLVMIYIIGRFIISMAVKKNGGFIMKRKDFKSAFGVFLLAILMLSGCQGKVETVDALQGQRVKMLRWFT